MSIRFDLVCEYIHCFGKHTVTLGSTDSEVEAKLWQEQQTQTGSRPPLTDNDPSRACPVVRCPLKRQTPRFDYHEQIQ